MLSSIKGVENLFIFFILFFFLFFFFSYTFYSMSSERYNLEDITNRYLFRDSIAGIRYDRFFKGRYVIPCFHFTPPEPPNPHVNFITQELQPCLNHWNLNDLI